jgi:hypothetical protein
MAFWTILDEGQGRENMLKVVFETLGVLKRPCNRMVVRRETLETCGGRERRR